MYARAACLHTLPGLGNSLYLPDESLGRIECVPGGKARKAHGHGPGTSPSAQFPKRQEWLHGIGARWAWVQTAQTALDQFCVFSVVAGTPRLDERRCGEDASEKQVRYAVLAHPPRRGPCERVEKSGCNSFSSFDGRIRFAHRRWPWRSKTPHQHPRRAGSWRQRRGVLHVRCISHTMDAGARQQHGQWPKREW